MQLYKQNINELENLDKLIENLSEYRKSVFFKYRQEKDRLFCLAADYLIKKHVSNAPVLKNEYGKPYIKDAPYFNVSHSGEYAILTTNDKPIGCDIEEIKDINVEAIAKRVFHEKEVNQLKAVNYNLKTFYKFWTLKESYMKMVGYGFSLKPKTFWVDLEGLKIKRNTVSELQEDTHGYIIAITREV